MYEDEVSPGKCRGTPQNSKFFFFYEACFVDYKLFIVLLQSTTANWAVHKENFLLSDL